MIPIGEIIAIRNFIGRQIDAGDSLDLQDLDHLWSWIDSLIGQYFEYFKTKVEEE